MGQPEQINPATYLGGGRDFGGFPTPTSPTHIISRNLTPDHNGVPIGGDTFEEFMHTIRTGEDPDLLHPNLPFRVQGRPAPDHAVAGLSKHERSRPSRDLRVPQRDPVRRQSRSPLLAA